MQTQIDNRDLKDFIKANGKMLFNTDFGKLI